AIKGGNSTLSDSTISGNKAGGNSGYGYGGGVWLRLYGNGTLPTIRQCTISGNNAAQGGGVFVDHGYYYSYTNDSIQNSTVAFNTAFDEGGGLWGSGFALASVIVGKNSAPDGPDIYSSGYGYLSAVHSLISNTSGLYIYGYPNFLNVDPLLGPLANHGGPTWTHALLPGSPAIDAGSNPANLTTDQRGLGFPRVIGSAADIGATEGIVVTPSAIASMPEIVSAGTATLAVSVTYTDNVGIDVSTLGTGDITVSGPNGFFATPVFTGIDVNTNGTPRVATYQFTAPGGSWNPNDTGTYTVTMSENQVFDVDMPTAHAAPGGRIGTVFVDVPVIYAVDTSID